MYLEERRQTTGIVTRLFLLEVIQSLVLSNRKEISSSHGGEYDVQSCLLGYTAV
jgi:hypothetical protein